MQTYPFRYWLGLLSLVAIWGSSFALIEIALTYFTPLKVTTLRLVYGGVVLLLLVVLLPSRMPRGKGNWYRLIGVAVFGNLLPFFMISVAQTHIDSATTGILMAIMPLSVLMFAALLLPDEGLNLRQVAGFLLGFSGVVLLLYPQLQWPLSGSITGHLLVLGGASSYGLATVFVRGLEDVQPWVSSAIVVLIGGFVMLPVSVSIEGWQGWLPDTGLVWVAVIFLGALGTGFATVLYFYVVKGTSAAFASTMNFMIPVWSTMLGTLALNEKLSSTAIPALVLVLLGIGVAQGRPGRAGQASGS